MKRSPAITASRPTPLEPPTRPLGGQRGHPSGSMSSAADDVAACGSAWRTSAPEARRGRGRRAVRPRERRVPLIRPPRRSARRRSPSAGHVPTPAARPLELALIGRSSLPGAPPPFWRWSGNGGGMLITRLRRRRRRGVAPGTFFPPGRVRAAPLRCPPPPGWYGRQVAAPLTRRALTMRMSKRRAASWSNDIVGWSQRRAASGCLP